MNMPLKNVEGNNDVETQKSVSERYHNILVQVISDAKTIIISIINQGKSLSYTIKAKDTKFELESLFNKNKHTLQEFCGKNIEIDTLIDTIQKMIVELLIAVCASDIVSLQPTPKTA